jgi:hypothetical protein
MEAGLFVATVVRKKPVFLVEWWALQVGYLILSYLLYVEKKLPDLANHRQL